MAVLTRHPVLIITIIAIIVLVAWAAPQTGIAFLVSCLKLTKAVFYALYKLLKIILVAIGGK